MDFSNDDLVLIGRALLDAAGRLKVEMGRLCEAEPYYSDIKERYDRTTALARKIVETAWAKKSAPGGAGDGTA